MNTPNSADQLMRRLDNRYDSKVQRPDARVIQAVVGLPNYRANFGKMPDVTNGVVFFAASSNDEGVPQSWNVAVHVDRPDVSFHGWEFDEDIDKFQACCEKFESWLATQYPEGYTHIRPNGSKLDEEDTRNYQDFAAQGKHVEEPNYQEGDQPEGSDEDVEPDSDVLNTERQTRKQERQNEFEENDANTDLGEDHTDRVTASTDRSFPIDDAFDLVDVIVLEVTEEEMHDKITEWHECTNGDEPLYKYLGMSSKMYTLWVTNPHRFVYRDELPELVEQLPDSETTS